MMPARLSHAAQFAALAMRRPVEFYDRIHGRRERLHGRRERARNGGPPRLNAVSAEPLQVAHQMVGVADADCCSEPLARVRGEVLGRLGPQGHYNDGGMALSEMLWVIVRHTTPRRVIETGVARGVSSAFILDAMTLNGIGHLWSIDLPPMIPGWQDQTGVAVPLDVRDRWTYMRGASRRLLPRLVNEEQPVDLFVHDSLHTVENMLFEMRTVWGSIHSGGFLVCDDAGHNHAVLTFAEEIGTEPTLVREESKGGVVAVFQRGP